MKKTLLLSFLGCLLSWNSFSQLVVNLQGNPLSSYLTGWTYGGSATAVDSTMRLTSTITNQNGYIYYASTYNTTSCPNFTVNFDFKISGSGANGLTFFFLSSPITPFSSGGTGAAIGLPSTTLNGISLILDTKDDDANSNNPLVALYGFNNTASYSESNVTNLVGSVQTNQSWMTDGTWHHVELTYSSGTLKVYLNNNATPQITGNFTLPNPTGYFGFTSSTSNTQASAHYIKSVSIRNAAPIHGTTTTLCSTQTATLVNAVNGGTWTSNNPSIASVNSSGLVTAGATAGTATITYTLPVACGSQSTSIPIIVNAVPSVNNITSQSICNGSSSTTVNFNGTPVGSTYTWSNSNTGIGLAASGTGNIASFTCTNAGIIPTSGNVTVTPTLNGCTGSSKTYSYTVNPTPTVNTPSNQTLCNGTQTSAVTFIGTVSSTTFNWTNSASSIGLPANGSGNISAFNALNNGATSVTATINVTPSANSCPGTPHNFTYTVNPTPTLPIIPSQTVCNNSTVNPISFNGTSGATYGWVNSNSAIGLGASGVGNLPSFTATNPGTAPIYATITVTPALNGCSGNPKYFNITVNPSPTLNAILDQSVCNNTSTLITVFSGQIPNTTFNWVNSNPSIGLAASGTGNILPFVGANTTNTFNTGTIIVTPLLNNCAGATKTFNYTIKPTPTVTIPSDMTLCNGTATSPIILSGAVAGSTFGWTNNKTSIGLASSGSDTIPSFTATFAPPNPNQTTPVNAIITVNPSANGCIGVSQSFFMKVYPIPIVNSVSDQFVCNGVKSDNVNFNGNLLNSVYNWVSDNPTIGMPSSGTGKLFGFNTINTGNVLELANITVTPDYYGCPGNPFTFSITVKPTPIMDTVINQIVCNGALTTITNFHSNVASTNFTWYNANNSIGLADSGTGNVPVFNAINLGVNPVYSSVYIIPTAELCNGDTVSYAYRVNPAPNVIKPTNQSICKDVSTAIVNFSGSVVGTSYSWTNNNTTIGLGASGNGNIPSFVGSNNDTVASIATISVTPTANNCLGTLQDFTITVNSLPQKPTIDIASPLNLCANTQFQNFGTLTPFRPDRYFTWSVLNGNVMVSGKYNLNCLISFPYAAHSVVTLSNTTIATSCSNNVSFDLDVASNLSTVPTMVYHNNYFICLENDVDNYYWGFDDVKTLDSTLIPSQSHQNYYEPNPDFTNKYYWVITTKNGCWQKTYYTQPAGILVTPEKGNNLNIFPNPANEVLNVSLDYSSFQESCIKLYDLMGKAVSIVPISHKNTQINIKELPSGVYILSYYQDGIRMISSRFIKN